MMAASTLPIAFLISIASMPDEGKLPSGHIAITLPSADVELSFVMPGRVAQVQVKEGDQVSAGQILAVLDDAADQVKLLQAKEESEDTTKIEAGEAGLDQKKVQLKKIAEAASRGSATSLELEQAQLDVKLADLSLKLARFEHQQSILRYEELKIRVENMSRKSPIDGRVEKVDIEAGEAVEASKSVMRVVRTDPLWIDVPVPLTEGRTLTMKDVARITFPSPGVMADGTIIFLSTVADAASDTLRVRVEVKNSARRPAGEHITVTFFKER
jgi:RND family efflux transporter MFP subunit